MLETETENDNAAHMSETGEQQNEDSMEQRFMEALQVYYANNTEAYESGKDALKHLYKRNEKLARNLETADQTIEEANH